MSYEPTPVEGAQVCDWCYEPTPVEGAQVCDWCDGSGVVQEGDEEVECPECDGLGEWFE